MEKKLIIKPSKTTVKELKDNFKKITGLTLRVYYGNNFAEDNLKLGEIGCIGAGYLEEKDFSGRRKIKTLEKDFVDFGLKVQIAFSDDYKLCNNDYTLSKAVKECVVKEEIKKEGEKMKLEANKYYIYKYKDTKVLTKTEIDKDGDLIANDILKIEGQEELIQGWEIENMLNKGNVEVLETYNSMEEYNSANGVEENNGLSGFYEFLKENNLTDRIPNPIDFKIEKLKEAIKKEEANIRGEKNRFREYFSMDEYEFGRQQYQVNRAFEDLTKAYDSFIAKSNSLEDDIKALQEDSSSDDLSFLTDIEELDLSGSDITSLPKEIIELKKLKKLNISNTKISKIDNKIVNGYSFNIDIRDTGIEITKELIENLKEGKYGTLKVSFDENTKIADDCKNESFVKIGIQNFIENEKDSIKKVKLANEYGINRLVIDPNTLTDEFFKLDLSKIAFLDLMSDTVSEELAEKLFDCEIGNIAFAYDTTVGNLEKKLMKDAETPEDIKENPDDVWYGVDYEDKELELTVVSYLDFAADYEPNNKDVANAVYDGAFRLKTSGEKVMVIESYDYEFKVVSLDSEDCLGELEWEYYSTDTNDGVLERYVNYCKGDFCDIPIVDILSFRLGYTEASDLANEYNIDYDCEQEGYYG